MKAALYPARIWQENGIYYVQFLDLENGFTYGNTLEEAKEMAADVLSALLSSALDHAEPIPEPGERQGEDIYLIVPDAKVQVMLMLRQAHASRSQEEIVRAMGIPWQKYQEIERTGTASLVDLQKVAKAFGKELIIELR
jgi:Uncharacterized conserved protein